MPQVKYSTDPITQKIEPDTINTDNTDTLVNTDISNTNTPDSINTLGSENETQEIKQEISIPDNELLGLSDEEFLKISPEIANLSNTQINTETIENSNQQINNLGSGLDTEVQSQDKDSVLKNVDLEHVKKFYETVTTEFNANGKPVKITEAEDAIRLMQMGINYNKKMQTIKPVLGLIKTLHQHNLTDEQQIKFLIDLSKYDKAAIAKLLKDGNVDTYELPDLEQTPYVSNTNIVTETQAEFQDTLNEINSLEKGRELLEGIQSWDDESIKFFADKPDALYILHQDKSSGLFDRVMQQIELDRTLGKIPESWQNKPVVELYDFVANQLYQANTPSKQQEINHIPPVNSQQNTPAVLGHNIRPDAQQVRSNPNVVPRTAAITTGTATQNNLVEVPNILGMTDAQFSVFQESLAGIKF